MSDDMGHEDARRVGPSTGGYVLERLLSSSPAGEIYEGYDEQGAVCSIKVLPAGVASDPTAVARFVQGCDLALRFDDPHLARVTNFVVEESTLAVVREPANGPTLREVLGAEGTLSPAQAAGLCADVLRGLATLHAYGLTHIDVNPDHIILVGADGSHLAVLTDYELGSLRDLGTATMRPPLPNSPRYQAPEAFGGQRLTAAADVYSVGVILHELLLGVVPYRQAITDSASLPLARPDRVLDELWDAIEGLMGSPPEGRPSSADAAAHLDGLAERLEGLPPLLPLPEPPAPMIAAGGAVALEPSAVVDPHEESRRAQVLAGAATALAFLAVGGVLVVGSALHGGGPSAHVESVTIDTFGESTGAQPGDPGDGAAGPPLDRGGASKAPVENVAEVPFAMAAAFTATEPYDVRSTEEAGTGTAFVIGQTSILPGQPGVVPDQLGTVATLPGAVPEQLGLPAATPTSTSPPLVTPVPTGPQPAGGGLATPPAEPAPVFPSVLPMPDQPPTSEPIQPPSQPGLTWGAAVESPMPEGPVGSPAPIPTQPTAPVVPGFEPEPTPDPWLKPTSGAEPEPEPEPTEDPGPTSGPEPGPEPTDNPGPTSGQEPTSDPEPTSGPEPTEDPGPTTGPEPEPEPTDNRGPTTGPEPEREPTDNPGPTTGPQPTSDVEPGPEPSGAPTGAPSGSDIDGDGQVGCVNRAVPRASLDLPNGLSREDASGGGYVNALNVVLAAIGWTGSSGPC